MIRIVHTRRLLAAAVVGVALLHNVRSADAATLSTAQLQALKADMNGDGAIQAIPHTSDGFAQIAALYNATASPDYWVWRTFVPDREIYEATTVDATTWSWTIYIARSQGERDAWRQMVNMAGGINASLASVRTGIADIFSGAGGLNQRTHLLTLGRRKATRGEKLFATGAGSTAAPSVMAVEGVITPQNIEAAFAS